MHPLQPVSEVPYMTRLLGYACVHVERPERYFALRERRGRYFSLREKGNAFAEQSCVRRMHCLNKLCIQSTIDLFLLNQMRKSCPISPHVLSFSELIYQPVACRTTNVTKKSAQSKEEKELVKSRLYSFQALFSLDVFGIPDC